MRKPTSGLHLEHYRDALRSQDTAQIVRLAPHSIARRMPEAYLKLQIRP